MRDVKQSLTFVILLVILASMIDTFVAAILDLPDVLKVVAGEKAAINGKLPASFRPVEGPPRGVFVANRIKDPALLAKILAYTPHHNAFTIRFVELRGRLWRAELITDAGAHAGDYPVQVYQAGAQQPIQGPAYRVQLFADKDAYRRSLASYFQKWLGIDPWWVAILLVPVVVFAFAREWKRSDAEEIALQQKGIGPIYKLTQGKDGWQIVFGLGSAHGVRPGDRLQVLDDRRRPTGLELTAEAVGRQSAQARLDLGADIRPDYLIGRRSD